MLGSGRSIGSFGGFCRGQLIRVSIDVRVGEESVIPVVATNLFVVAHERLQYSYD